MYKQLSPEEQIFEQHFTQTTTRDPDGRFVGKLPFKGETGKLANGYKAEKQFFSLERRLEKDPASQKQYSDLIKEFLDMKHLEEIPSEKLQSPESESYYIPHHV